MKLLIFGTPTCSNCKALVKTVKDCFPITPAKLINIYKKPELAIKYDIRAFPTLVGVYDDDTSIKIIGNVSREGLISWLKDELND